MTALFELEDVVVELGGRRVLDVPSLAIPDGGITEIWLPTDKNKPEIGRIIQNMAIAMGQPRPNLPQELLAGSVPAPEKSRL